MSFKGNITRNFNKNVKDFLRYIAQRINLANYGVVRAISRFHFVYERGIMKGFLSDLPNNTKYCIVLEPMWAIFGTVVLFYAPLYMKATGVNEIQIGIITSVSLYFGAMFHFLAGSITNKFGRKRTTFLFDLLSWSVPMIIWVVAQNFWYFLIAGIINATSKVVNVSFNCLLIEDVGVKSRSKVYGIIYVIICSGGLLTPVSGSIMSKYEIIPTMKLIYVLGAIIMTLMFILRNRFVNETRAGVELMNKYEGVNILCGIKNSLKNAKNAIKDKNLRLMVAIYIITNFIVQMNIFLVLFYKDHLGFNELELSFIPVVGAIANILLYIRLVSKNNKLSDERNLVRGILMSVLSTISIIIIPRGNVLILLTVSALLAVSTLMMQTYRDSILVNRIDELEKADMLSAIQTVTTLMIIPSGYISGILYNSSPKLLFIIMAAMYAITLIIALRQKNENINMKVVRVKS